MAYIYIYIYIYIGNTSIDENATISADNNATDMEVINSSVGSLSHHDERNIHKDDADNDDELLENDSNDDTVSMHHKKVFLIFH